MFPIDPDYATGNPWDYPDDFKEDEPEEDEFLTVPDGQDGGVVTASLQRGPGLPR